ncbi:MAG: hypothetical protein J5843_00235, partial [Clostridia bacterium]|nr:hypothetical protein [Clostridia bacterium]
YLYGVYRGYLLSLYDSGKNKTVFVNYYLDCGEDESDSIRLMELSEQLKSILSSQVILDLSVQPDGLSYTLACSFDEFFELLEDVLSMLNESGIAGVSKCSNCGNTLGKRFPKKVLVGKNNYLVCDHCALEALENSKNVTAEKASAPARTGLGLLGALAGGLIGTFICFALYQWIYPLIGGTGFDFRYIFTACGLLTAFLVYKGYTLLSKKASMGEAVIVTVCSLLFTAIGQYAGSFASYAKLQGFTLFDAMRVPSMWLIHLRSTVDTSLMTDQTVLDTYNVAPLFYRLLFISLLFALIGSILFQVGFFEKNRTKKVQVEVETYKGPRETEQASPASEPDGETEPDNE